MIDELIKVSTELFNVRERFNQSGKAQKQRISQYFHNIEDCLQSSVELLEEGKVPHEKWGALSTYGWELPGAIGKEIGEDKARSLAEKLIWTASHEPSSADIPTIKKAAGQFRALAHTVETKSAVIPSPARRTLLTYAALTSAGAVGASLFHEALNTRDAGSRKSENPTIQQQETGTTNHPPKVEWVMETFLSDSAINTILWQAPQTIRDQIEKMSDGEFVITLDRSGKTQEILEKVSEGSVQCGYNGTFYAGSKYKALFFGCSIPFGLNAQEQNAWLNYRKGDQDGTTYMQSVYQKLDLNIIPFPAGSTGTQMGGWFNKRIETVDDFKDLRMRIPGIGADVLGEFGVKNHTQLAEPALAIDESIKRFKKGDFDAVEWNGPWDDRELGLSDPPGEFFYHYPGWWEPCTTFEVQVNKGAWEKLSPKHQNIFKNVCSNVHADMLSEYNYKNALALSELTETGTLNLQEFSSEILKEAKIKTDKLLESYTQSSVFEEVYTEWREFKERIQTWSKYNLSEYI